MLELSKLNELSLHRSPQLRAFALQALSARSELPCLLRLLLIIRHRALCTLGACKDLGRHGSGKSASGVVPERAHCTVPYWEPWREELVHVTARSWGPECEDLLVLSVRCWVPWREEPAA
eukprot:9154867-Pyramimonas_sp.AAC.1